MAVDKPKVLEQPRVEVHEDQEYEVRYFAQENGITPDQARELIGRHGNDRATLAFEVKKLRR